VDPQTSRSVVVLGDVGGELFHVGDEAMMEANLALLQREAPSARISVLGRRHEPGEVAGAVAEADAVLLAGGGGLAEGWPELAAARIALLEEAGRRSVPIATGGQTIVPGLEGPLRKRLADALARVGVLGLRELPSTAFALELGLDPERVVYQVDDAFGLTGTRPADEALQRATDGPYLAVTLDGSYGSDAALGALRSLASQIAMLARELGLQVVFVPHYGTLGAAGDHDASVGGRLAGLLRLAGAACHVAPLLPVREAVWLAHNAALTLSSRYHPLVFASAAARPCVGLYRDAFTFAKVHGALAHVGAERRCLSTAAAEAGGLIPVVRACWAERQAISERMGEARAAIDGREQTRQAQLVEALGLGAARPGATAVSIRAVHTAPSPTAPPVLTDEQWDQFSRDGFMHLGQVLDADEIERLTQRADDLAMGRVHNEHVKMQLDTGGAYEELPGEVDAFDEGTQMYRKIQGLEMDDAFAPLIGHARFIEVCGRIYGPHVPLSIFRAMVMNKPAGQGTNLPWHQDGGDVWALDREPLVTIWIALDEATTANGCMDAVRGSHRLGLLSNYGSTLSDEHAAEHCPDDRVVPLEVPAGHAVLMHNWLIHRSGVNPSPAPRRAVTICYLDGRTRSVLTGDHFPIVAGTVDASPQPYIRELKAHSENLQANFTSCEEYATSLRAELDASEAERQRLQAALDAASTAPPPNGVRAALRASLRYRLRRFR
jgi:polysaccharide pyruvyl transferase WcaK-like protein